MDQSQWSVALEWRDRTIPRWPDSFPGSYGFPRRAWIFEKHSSIALEWTINPRECGPSKQAQGVRWICCAAGERGSTRGFLRISLTAASPNLNECVHFQKKRWFPGLWSQRLKYTIHREVREFTALIYSQRVFVLLMQQLLFEWQNFTECNTVSVYQPLPPVEDSLSLSLWTLLVSPSVIYEVLKGSFWIWVCHWFTQDVGYSPG